MKVTRDQALSNAISLLEVVDMTSDWYAEAVETVKVLQRLQTSLRKRKSK